MNRADLAVYEDAEQAAALSQRRVTLHYSEKTLLILRGEFRGQKLDGPVDTIKTRLIGDAMPGGTSTLRVRFLSTHPWWRLFRETPAVQVTCHREVPLR